MAVNATMPMYEYQCRKCKHRFERIQKLSRDAGVSEAPAEREPAGEILSGAKDL